MERDYSFSVGPDGFKNIKNYIHNYLGLTKKEVHGLVEEILRDIVIEEITKVLNDEGRVKRLIENEVVRQINRNQSERRSYVVSTLDEIYNKIDKEIHNEVLKRLNITLKSDNPMLEEIKRFYDFYSSDEVKYDLTDLESRAVKHIGYLLKDIGVDDSE